MRFGRARGAWPVLGHLIALRSRPLALLDSLSAYGDLVEIRLGSRPAFVRCHPALARQVLADFRSFDRTGLVYDRVRAAMGCGLATVPYPHHRRQRLLLQPAFRHEHLPGYVAVMRQQITAVMDTWHDGGLVDLVEEMFTLTTTVTLRALFSSQIGPEQTERLRQAFDVFLHGIYARAVLPVAGLLPTPSSRRYAKAVAFWRSQVTTLIDACRQADARRGDLMSRLLAARDEQGRAMSGAELADQVAVLLLAGAETTAAAVVWSWHLLSGHPQILAALHTEVDTVLGRDVAGWDHLPRLDVTAQVVREALRLYPPAWVIPRTCVRETRLAGRTLPAGSMVIFSPYILHRRPDLYPQPHRFDPGRWLAPAPGRSAHRGSFLPFGTGATRCIGGQFGFTEATLTLASIAARWNLSPEPAPRYRRRPEQSWFPERFRSRLSRR
jgi:cytochrome P450